MRIGGGFPVFGHPKRRGRFQGFPVVPQDAECEDMRLLEAFGQGRDGLATAITKVELENIIKKDKKLRGRHLFAEKASWLMSLE